MRWRGQLAWMVLLAVSGIVTVAALTAELLLHL